MMGSAYLEAGYLEAGYLEGADADFPEDDSPPSSAGESVRLKFFLTESEGGDRSALQAGLAEGEFALLFGLQSSTIELFSPTRSARFLASDPQIEARVASLEERLVAIENSAGPIVQNPSISVSMRAPDGTLLAAPDVTREGTSFRFGVPLELSGAAYSVVVDLELCDECGESDDG